MLVAAVQHDIVWEDRDATLARLEPRLAAAAADGAPSWCCRRRSRWGSRCAPTSRRRGSTGRPPPGWRSRRPRTASGWPARSRSGPRRRRPQNVLVLAGPGGERHRYAKRNLFTYGHEDDAFDAGHTRHRGDRRPPRHTERLLRPALRRPDVGTGPGTDCFVVVANWPRQRQAHFRALLLPRAIENQCYVVGVNRVGRRATASSTSAAAASSIRRASGVADAEPAGAARSRCWPRSIRATSRRSGPVPVPRARTGTDRLRPGVGDAGELLAHRPQPLGVVGVRAPCFVRPTRFG